MCSAIVAILRPGLPIRIVTASIAIPKENCTTTKIMTKYMVPIERRYADIYSKDDPEMRARIGRTSLILESSRPMITVTKSHANENPAATPRDNPVVLRIFSRSKLLMELVFADRTIKRWNRRA